MSRLAPALLLFAGCAAVDLALVLAYDSLNSTVNAPGDSSISSSIGVGIGTALFCALSGALIAATLYFAVRVVLEMRDDYCFDCSCECNAADEDDEDDDLDADDQEFEEDPLNPGTYVYPVEQDLYR